MASLRSRFLSVDRQVGGTILGAAIVAFGAAGVYAQESSRVVSGLQVFYDFNETGGKVIHDRSGIGKPLNLTIVDQKSVRHKSGSLEMIGKGTLIRSGGKADRVNNAIKRSGEFTVEAWLKPANTKQSGPARIVTLSKDSSTRNFTLGQDGDKFAVRFRATGTSTNGIPSTDTKSKTVQTKLTHIAYTRDRSGRTNIFLNGKSVQQGKAGGGTNNWDNSFPLALGDELVGGRRWLGTYHLVAIYSSRLSPAEVMQNFRAGPTGNNAEAIAKAKADRRRATFVNHVAPLLSKHCLECHDSATRNGGLDLSRAKTALAGGDSGPGIVAGKSAESLVWTSVENDEMPHDRDALNADEKKLLKTWIDDGAVWSLDFIDPAVYVHSSESKSLWVQRLTIPEYVSTVRDAVGVDVEAEAYDLLPPDMRADGFNNTAYNLNVDLKHVDAYARLARIIVGRMDALKLASRFHKGRRLTDDNMRQLIAKMGKWILRGPLDDNEVVLYRGISTTVASAGGDFQEAVRYIVEAMLQSPRFIYRVESHVGDGTMWPAAPYELASRMSYILWGAPPDQRLMDAAESGELADESKVKNFVQHMLKDPRAIKQSREFVRQWMNLPRLKNMRPNQDHFPNWDPKLADDMRDETLAYFEEVIWKRNLPLSALLNTQVTFLTPELASHYGIKPGKAGLQKYDLTEVKTRGGILTQGSTLTIGGDEASMVTRGLLVMHELLRGVVNDPPPCVDTTPVPTKPGVTQRTIAESRIKNESCGGCHSKFEPLAFGLEKFDGLGGFHEKDSYGNMLREDGEVLIPGESEPQKYTSSAQLMDILANSERVKESLTWKLTQFALGRPLVAADAPIVSQIHQSAQKQGGTYQSLMTAIVLSDLVQMTRTEAK